MPFSNLYVICTNSRAGSSNVNQYQSFNNKSTIFGKVFTENVNWIRNWITKNNKRVNHLGEVQAGKETLWKERSFPNDWLAMQKLLEDGTHRRKVKRISEKKLKKETSETRRKDEKVTTTKRYE